MESSKDSGFATVTNFGTIDGLNHVAIFAFTDVNVTNGAGGQITSLINNGIYASNGVAPSSIPET